MAHPLIYEHTCTFLETNIINNPFLYVKSKRIILEKKVEWRTKFEEKLVPSLVKWQGSMRERNKEWVK